MAEKKAHLPNLLHIGYQSVSVCYAKEIDHDALGVYQPSKSAIFVKEGIGKREELNTVLHECLHACIYTYGLKEFFKDDDEEEKLVNTLGNALTQVLVSNPKLAQWIVKNAR